MDTDSLLEGPMDEEERWLDALEKGELDDNGELKKEIDESLLTARQVGYKKQPGFSRSSNVLLHNTNIRLYVRPALE